MDLSITYTSPSSAKAQKFIQGFLRAQPVPVDDEGSPTMTEIEWVKEWGRGQFLNEYRKGTKLLKQDEAVTETDVLG